MRNEYTIESMQERLADGPTEADMLRQAYAAQDACNLSGVVHTFSSLVTQLWKIARARGKGTDWVNRHPVCIILADKLRDLSRSTSDRVFSVFEQARILKERKCST